MWRAITVERVYDLKEPRKDSYYVLVDRLWPRGISKNKLRCDLWPKDLAPSPELRKFYNHEVEKYPEFKKRYFDELATKAPEINNLMEKVSGKRLVLLTATKDVEHSGAEVLKQFLEAQKINWNQKA